MPSAVATRPFVARSTHTAAAARAAAAAALPRLPAAGLHMTRTARACAAHARKGDDSRASPSPSPSPQPTTAAAIARAPSLDDAAALDAPFLEPLLRNLVLGVSAGALAELLHVCITAASATHPGGLAGLTGSLPAALSPLYGLDHAVAIGVWALLYLIEARTVSSILDSHASPSEAAHTIKRTMTLPKLLMPLSLNSLKRTVYRLVSGRTAAPATASPSVSAFANGSSSNGFSRQPSFDRTGSSSMSPARSGSSTSSVDDAWISSGLDRRASSTSTSTELMERQASVKPSRSGSINNILPAPLRRSKSKDQQGLTSKRSQELKERKAYLKNFWYAAGISSELKPGKTKEVQMMGRTVVLFRDEDGTVRCLDNLCPHRGAPLSKGWVKKVEGHNCVVCPYHGWAFDGEGRLKDVPSNPAGTHLPKRALVDAYPVEEQGGFIWLFFGSKNMPAEERPPIPCIPELNDPNWRAVYGELEFDAPHWSVFDNALDMAHIHYVHQSSFGNQDKPEIMDMNFERSTYGIEGTFRIHNKPANPLWDWTKVESVPVEVKGFLPATSAVRITLAHGIQMITFVNTVPIDEKRSINRFCLIRNFATSPVFDPFVRKSMFQIIGEDKDIVDTLNPDATRAEISFGPDLPQIAFRKLRQEWVDLGYAVDPATTTGHRGSLSDI